MLRILIAGAALLAATPAAAAFVNSSVLAGGGVALVNTATGTISICYRHLQGVPRCVTAGSFGAPAANVRAVAADGGQILYLYDTAGGRTVRCDLGTTTATVSGWTCVLAAATLP